MRVTILKDTNEIELASKTNNFLNQILESQIKELQYSTVNFSDDNAKNVIMYTVLVVTSDS